MSITQSVLEVGAVVLTACAVIMLMGAFFQAWREARKARVAIPTLVDATGDDKTKVAVVGLTHLLREELHRALPRLAERMTKEIHEAEKDPTSPLATLVREDVAIEKRLVADIGSSQQELTNSITSLSPESVRGALRVISETMSRPRGVRISGVLQRFNDGSGGVGLSFAVDDLQGNAADRRVSLWEDPHTDVDGKTVVQRLRDLIVPASRALACELLHQHLTARMSKRRLGRWLGTERRERSPKLDPGDVVEFLIGTGYLTAAPLYPPATMSLYEQAERALTKIKELDHYRVLFVRAEALFERARTLEGHDAVTLLHKSTELYEQARENLRNADLDPSDRVAAEVNIQAGLAIISCLFVEHVPDEPWTVEAAAKATTQLLERDTSPLEDSKSMQNSTALYNMASALTVASGIEPLSEHGVDLARCLVRARECLLHACQWTDQWWDDGKVDPDLRLLWPWMPEAHRQVLAAGGEAVLDREVICAIATGSWRPKVQADGGSSAEERRAS